MQNRFKNIAKAGLFVLCSNFSYAQKTYIPVPQSQFDLSDFNLQLPIEKNNSITIIKGADIPKFSSENFYFSPEDTSIRLFCSSDGKTTQGSHYPRTELRQISEWHFENQHHLQVKMAVLKQPGTGKIIIGQIHGNSKGTEAVKIWWNNGNLQVGFKKEVDDKEQRITLLKNIPLGQVFEYSIEQNNLNIQVKINQQTTVFSLGNSWKHESVYFKAGNYLQDNKFPVTSGTVAIYQIKTNS
ncbi:Alginate lyase [Chryseobacterium nakagawai]|uniref:Polysaccharide lyase family 7 protein n=1 Tax=Chryseobacterium nakagawai TaxID=1241982 RepID=A0AAD0YEH6_CHRNA|nr:polysaccharide lyase family 7 protein [Chryseobacterium nakagawai]AZA89666.1 polysaccharide lyase family 7 protein [Chryseobacterium nakagawai]VEH21047.1 Alginate lyase [Chryseobacterium nakagawai]